jgi:EmrB/QacA subfamily drug resistance transporter
MIVPELWNMPQRLHAIPYRWLVAAAFVSAMFLQILDTTIVGVALPALGREFAVGNETLQWIMTAYLLSMAVWIPASGWVGDRFGTKRTFLASVGVFTLGSALCGAAWDIGSLIGFRALQGVGGGMLIPVGTAMLFRAFPPRERAQASSVLTIPTVIAPTLGPLLGGVLVDQASWRWIFFVNLPVGLLAFVFVFGALREHREARPGPFDGWGFVSSGLGLASLLYGLSRGPVEGWTSPTVLATGLIGLALLASMVVVELRLDNPMLDLRLFGNRMFRGGSIAVFALTGGLFGILFLVPLFLQQLRGLSALETGLTIFPQALGMAILSQAAGRIYPRIGPRRMLMFGCGGVALAPALFTLVGLDTDLGWIRGIMFLQGLSMGFTFVALQAATFSSISSEATGRASALFSSVRQVAGAVGVALLSTVLVSRTAVHLGTEAEATALGLAATTAQVPVLEAFHSAFAAAALIALLGVAAAWLIRDEDAAESMRRLPAEPEPAHRQVQPTAASS